MVRDERRFKMADKDGDLTATKEEFTAFLHPEEYDYMKDIVVQVGPLWLVISQEVVVFMAKKWMERIRSLGVHQKRSCSGMALSGSSGCRSGVAVGREDWLWSTKHDFWGFLSVQMLSSCMLVLARDWISPSKGVTARGNCSEPS